MRSLIILSLLATLLTSCSIAPKEINYGYDQCHGCRMIISDQRFGSELVTTKGKVFKFDAIECMVPELLNKGSDQYAYTLVTDYANPGKLTDAHNLNFLISQDLASPMGHNLSGHSTTKLDPSINDVTWYQWSEILEQFRQ